VFAVWAYVIANTDHEHHVEINPVMVGALLGMEFSQVESVVEKFCAPDPKSRTKENEGRKLVHVSGFLYFVVNHEAYRQIRNEDERREYFKVKKQEQRARQKNSKTLPPQSATPQPGDVLQVQTEPLSSVITDAMVEKWRVMANEGGGTFTPEETRHAFLALKANGFKWGGNDWRAALERQIGFDRNRTGGNGATKAAAPVGEAQRLYLAKDELDRLEKEITSLKNGYDTHQDWSRSDADKLKAFRVRQKELKSILGFTV
jgi:hypothetical protein